MLSAYNRARLLLSIGTLLCAGLFWWAGQTFHIPFTRHLAASLLLQPGWVSSAVVVAVMLGAAVVIGTLIAGTVRFDAGLFTACLALMVFSLRGQGLRAALFEWGSHAYVLLTFEVFVLYAMLFGAWELIHALSRKGLVKPDVLSDGVGVIDEPITQRLLATLTHAIVMMLAMLILCQSQAKAQVLASVGISSFVGAWVAYSLYLIEPSIWFWAAPALVAIAGYLAAWINPDGWQTGSVNGLFGPLARALPLDYASAGTAGAILGYWISRHAQQTQPSAQPAPEPPPSAPFN